MNLLVKNVEENMNKEKLREEVVEISEMEDGWDSYGAESFTKETIDKVNEIIDCLDDKYPDPCIVPSPMGIQFEWDRSKYNYLEISVDDINSEISYLQGFGEGVEDYVDKKISNPSEINELLEEFYKNVERVNDE